MSDVKMKRHEDVESLLMVILSPMAEDAGVDPKELVGIGVDAEGGEPVEYTFAQQVEGIEHMGLWGMYDHNTDTIHYWTNGQCAEGDFYNFLAHELQHRYHDELERIIAEELENPVFHELCADYVGNIAKEAHEIYMKIQENTMSDERVLQLEEKLTLAHAEIQDLKRENNKLRLRQPSTEKEIVVGLQSQLHAFSYFIESTVTKSPEFDKEFVDNIFLKYASGIASFVAEFVSPK